MASPPPDDLTITIPSTHTAHPPDDSKPYTVYDVHVTTSLRTTVLRKRYSDFAALHASLLSATDNAAPPAPLPQKSWFPRSTVNNPSLTEARRQGLEAYMQAVASARDARWRSTRAWRAFLDLNEEPARRASKGAARLGSAAGAPANPSSPADWLDAHRDLKACLHDARAQLARREQAPAPAAQHDAGASAKKSLVRAGQLIHALEAGLDRMAAGGGGDGWPADKLGDGEVRRRRDMIGAAKKERDGLESLLGSMAAKTAKGAAAESSRSGSATPSEAGGGKEMLFKGGGGGGGRGRVLGAPPPKETERTRELDNEGVLQLQRQIMQEQDEDVFDLAKAVRRMKDMGIQINDELEAQTQMLDLLDQDVDRVGGKIRIAKKRTREIR
ncbi:Phox homologous domain-containing protein [Lineolata rhizophorae]|uniref:Phox homologous domain-containing protein n=1 Tax=Lineolata rhizophorae TaxID=578093 RepID=A0A6A6NW26_9PEZI|nr:Phox homologous domain-containing protein [Lineolata rhizophorae]